MVAKETSPIDQIALSTCKFSRTVWKTYVHFCTKICRVFRQCVDIGLVIWLILLYMSLHDLCVQATSYRRIQILCVDLSSLYSTAVLHVANFQPITWKRWQIQEETWKHAFRKTFGDDAMLKDFRDLRYPPPKKRFHWILEWPSHWDLHQLQRRV